MPRRLGGCRISHTPFASLSLGSLGARLAARFVAIQAVCGFAAAFGSPPPKPKAAASSHQQFFTSKQCVYIDVFVRSLAYNKLKTHLLRREAKLLTRSASKPKTAWGGRGAGTPAPYCIEELDEKIYLKFARC